MGENIWIAWLVLAAVFFIGEIFTAGFFLLWFAIGAAVAALLAALGLGGVWQVGIFAVVSAVLFAYSRRFAERISSKQPPGIGADRFLGKKGVVLEEIDNIKNTGRVRIGQDEWRADSDSGDVIPVDKPVEVVRLDGTHLVVKVLEQGE